MSSVPFGDDPRDQEMSEQTVLHLARLRGSNDYDNYRTRLLIERAAVDRQRAAAERERISAERNARRQQEMTAPGLTLDDAKAIQAVMVERRCDVCTAAVVVGEIRAAAAERTQ